MKQFNKLMIMGTMLVAVLGSSCKKSFFDINKDPNLAVESNISPDLVAPQALLNSANRTATSYAFLNFWLGYWAPSAGFAPAVEEQSYNINTNFASGLFGGLLDNAYDYQFMENKAAESKQTFYQGIAKIMKSNNFAQLVDVYGNVPYSEALQGLKSVRPKYDDGKAIYEDILKQIDTGIALIKGAVESENLNITNADIMFAGDKTNWIKFANTLKLRILMTQSNRADRAAYVQAEIAKIVAEGTGFLSSDAAVKPAYTTDKANAYYSAFGWTAVGNPATSYYRGNVIAMNYMKVLSDPRLGYYYRAILGNPASVTLEPLATLPPNTYRGNQYGLPIDNSTYKFQAGDFVSQVGGVAAPGAVSASSGGLYKGYNQAAWIITSVESKWLQAEAINKGFLAGDAKTAYMNAIKESFVWLNVGGSAAAATTAFNNWYSTQVTLANKNVDWDLNTTAAEKSRLLIFQKYLSMNGIDPLQVWNDFRRYTGGVAQVDPDPTKYAPGNPGTGSYPYLDLSMNPGRSSSVIPVRMLYPQRELELNTANVPQAGVKSGDQFTVKIWWMP